MNTIKELKDLEAVRESIQSKINLRRHHEGPQVIISAGEYEEGGLARQLVAAFLEAAAKANMLNLAVKLCDAPAGEVKTIVNGEEKTYTDVTVDKVAEIFATVA